MNDNCPCDAVKELKVIVERHDRQLNSDHTQFAEIQKDIHYIKEALDKKGRMNMATFSSIVQAVCTLLVGLIAAKMGFGL